jgi:hypothetical protein
VFHQILFGLTRIDNMMNQNIFNRQYNQALASLTLIPQAASKPETESSTGPISSLKFIPLPAK